jgi:hypothetical protein
MSIQESYLSGGEFAQNKSLKSKEGCWRRRWWYKISPSSSGGLYGEGLLNHQISEGKEPSNRGNAVPKGTKPTADKGNANRDGSGIE